MKVADAVGQRQDLGQDVEIEGAEERELLVAALHVLTERGVGPGAQRRVRGVEAGNGSDRLDAVRAAGEGDREVRGRTLRDRHVIEVHLVFDVELLPVDARQRANAVVVGGLQAELMTLMVVLHLIAP